MSRRMLVMACSDGSFTEDGDTEETEQATKLSRSLLAVSLGEERARRETN